MVIHAPVAVAALAYDAPGCTAEVLPYLEAMTAQEAPQAFHVSLSCLVRCQKLMRANAGSAAEFAPVRVPAMFTEAMVIPFPLAAVANMRLEKTVFAPIENLSHTSRPVLNES
jgi:hypothetical protein